MSAETHDPQLTITRPAGNVGVSKSSAAVPSKLAPSIAQSMLGRAANRDWKKISRLTMLSLLLHVIALGAIGLIAFTNPQLVEEFFTTITEDEGPIEPIVEHSMLPLDNFIEVPKDEILTDIVVSDLQFENKGPISLNFSDAAPQIKAASADVTSQAKAVLSDAPGIADIKVGVEMVGRMSAKSKAALLKQFGGTTASEAAVASGLNWLASHQMRNGSWTFQPSVHPECKGKCTQNGILKSCPNGATALALLAFLGAGHTHFGGDYRTQVDRALEFLEKSAKHSGSVKGLDFRGNGFGIEGMYVHGLCAIALSECAAMTNDTRLRKTAQGAIEFIVNTQNQSDGGWRYRLGQPGDTSVVGWQVMALKSADNARIEFPHQVFKGTENFLNLAQTDRGTHYIYVPGRRRGTEAPDESMTAVGLLCRMYLGWDRSNPQLAAGVQYLAGVKPQRNKMYFNYYATQVMHHWGGEEWTRWNEVMRDYLVESQHQPRTGHMAGSWDVADEFGDAGGRLYMTCLSIMTLEVYYRHLPLYDREKLKVEF